MKGLISKVPIRTLTKSDMYRANIGERYYPVKLESIPKECAHLEPLKNWLANIKDNVENGKGIRFLGTYGTGKTASAVICAKNVIARGGTAYFTRGNPYTNAVLNNLMFDSDETIKERAEKVDLLIVDDMGCEAETSFSRSVLEELLRGRSDKRKCTIITTNLTNSLFKDKFGESITNFLSATTINIVCSGFDFRNNERKEIN